MKILTSIFTSDSNKEFFDTCVFYYKESKRNVELKNENLVIDLLVINFSLVDMGAFNGKVSGMMYLRHPGAGFCKNFNISRDMAIQGNYDYLLCLNDDSVIHEDFIKNGIEILEKFGDIGFAGGMCQKGIWKEDLSRLRIPAPISLVTDLIDIRRLHWEFSACMIPRLVLEEVGEMDELFSPKIGLVSDNDYLLRIRNLGMRTVRNGSMTFWHSRGRSQSKIRDPFLKKDRHKERAARYMKLKWGVDISDLNGPKIVSPIFSEPFNGKSFEVIDGNNIMVDGIKYNLWEG
jgi:hypothetical protein